MTDKIRKILLVFLFALFAATVVSIAFTAARYTGEEQASPDGSFSGDIDYIVSSQTEVHSVEEFLSAVANGYPNIKIADDVPNPFLVTSGVEQLNADLILDLNGHDIQRNSRDPMLKIGGGVKMVVIDTSEGAGGSFYNPVGSVLAIEGGTLTVINGVFESGVRESEYYGSGGDVGHGEITDVAATATVYVKQADSGEYEAVPDASVPVIIPEVTKKGNGYYVNGNLYIDGGAYEQKFYYTQSGGGRVSLTPFDTYLFFAISDAEAAGINGIVYAEGSADYHYGYYVEKSVGADGAPVYTYTGKTEGDNVIEVNVYGYYNDIASAENRAGTGYGENGRALSNFAAIKMKSGNLYVKGGDYYSHFGVDSAYCVYAEGGLMSVDGGSFRAVKDGVCVNCSFLSSSEANGLNVTGGSFLSCMGDTIQVNSGRMSVTGGTFVKDARAGSGAAELDNHSAIEVRAGELTVKGADDSDRAIRFNIYGSYTCAIECSGGSSLIVSNAVFDFNRKTDGYEDASAGVCNIGIYNDSGEIKADNCLFRIPDDNGTGIVSTLSASAAEKPTLSIVSSIFSLTGGETKGIRADAGTVELGDEESIGVAGEDRYVMFYIDRVYNCYGVYVQSDTTEPIIINANTAQFIMGQYADTAKDLCVPEAYSDTGSDTAQVFNGAGIFMDATGARLNIRRAMICSAGSFTAGVYMKRGELAQETDIDGQYKFAVLMGVKQDYYGSGGVYDASVDYSKNGDLSYNGIGHYRQKFGENWFIAQYGAGYYKTGGKFNVAQANARGSYGVFSSGGTISVSDFYVALYSTYGYAMYTKGGTINISDFESDVIIAGNTSRATPVDGASSEAEVTSAAIMARGGNVYMSQSNVKTDGYGYIVESGSLVFRNSTQQTSSDGLGKNVLAAERATAILVSDGTLKVEGKETLDVTCAIGEGLRGFDGEAIHTHGIYVDGGSFISEGTLEVYFTGLENDRQSDVSVYAPLDNLVKSYAVMVSGSSTASSAEASVNIKRCSVVSAVGGGVFVDGGNVVLGESGYTGADKNSRITVSTIGSEVYDTDLCGGTGDNWQYYVSRTGGHAVKVAGGDINIYYGGYTAAVGNGILVSGGKATIYDGSFNGNYSSFSYSTNDTGSGLGSYYGLLLYYGGTFISYGGNYTGFNGGAFVAGTSGNNANAYVYGGRFRATSTGSNGVSIGLHTSVVFGLNSTGSLTGAEVSAGVDASSARGAGKISVIGWACAIALENSGALGENTVASTCLDIYKGTYMATRSGNANVIWYGNSLAELKLSDCTLISSDAYDSANTSSSVIGNPYDGSYYSVLWSQTLVDGFNAYSCDGGVCTLIDTDTYPYTTQTGTVIVSDALPNGGWTADGNTVTLAENVTSAYKVAFTQDTLYTFGCAVNGGTLTVTYLDDSGETVRLTVTGTLDGAELRVSAASTLTFAYTAGEGAADGGDCVRINVISSVKLDG